MPSARANLVKLRNFFILKGHDMTRLELNELGAPRMRDQLYHALLE